MNASFVPNVQVFEEFLTSAAPAATPLNACIVGPNAQLVRYTNASEQANGLLSVINPASATTYPWPNLGAGALVDLNYPAMALWCQNAKLAFYSQAIGVGSTVTCPGAVNQVTIAGSYGFTGAGGASRLAGLYNRDVRLGDRVRVSAVVSSVNYTLDSYVTGFVGDPVVAITGTATADAGNEATQTLSTTVVQTAGAVNCNAMTASLATYQGLPTGGLNDTYTVTVTQASTGNNLTTAVCSLSSASGLDNVASFSPAAAASPVTVGARGFQVTFTQAGGPCNLVAGQTFQATIAQSFTTSIPTSGGTYTGIANDTYIATVTKGGFAAASGASLPQVTVTTAHGLDAGGPYAVAAGNAAFPIGTQGVTLKLVSGTTATGTATLTSTAVSAIAVGTAGTGYAASPLVTISGGGGSGATATATISTAGIVTGFIVTAGGTGYTSAPTVTVAAPLALSRGDRFYIPATSATTGRAGTLVLADSLPAQLQSAVALNLWLYTEQTLAINPQRLGSNPLLNWTAAANGLTVNSGATVQLPGFVDGSGIPIQLPVIDGILYASYRAWLPALSGAVSSLTDPTAVSTAIPGTLDPDNPLAFAVYMALSNSGGNPVYYAAVANPTAAASWSAALALLVGNTAIYKIVPLTENATYLALVQAHIDAQSSPEAGCNRSGFFTIRPPVATPLVNQATSSDGQSVLATLAVDPTALTTVYTVLTITSSNAALITANVQPGDTVRFFFTTAFGSQTYQSFTVASVVSQTVLKLTTSGGSAVTTPQLVEVWHTLSNDDKVTNLINQAATYSDSRICCIWSDLFGGQNGTSTLFYYHVAAALAGLRSSAPAQMSLTGVAIAGLGPYATANGFLNTTQVGNLSANGVWVVTRTPAVDNNAIITRLATTTNPGSPVNIETREEMIRTNVDSMELYIRTDLQQYLSQTNMVATALAAIRTQLVAAHTYLLTHNRTDRLGGQLISYNINAIGQHTQLLDTLVVSLSWVIPAPINAIQVNSLIVVGSDVSINTSATTTTGNAAS